MRSGVLSSTTITVEPSVSPFNSVNSCFTYLGTPLLGCIYVCNCCIFWLQWTFYQYIITANRWWKSGSSDRFYFLGLQNHCGWWLQPWNLKMLAPWKESYDKPRQCIKKQRHHFANKSLHSQSYSFSSSQAWTWELDHKGWVPKNWCLWIAVLEKTLESPLYSKEIKPVNLKGN